MNNITILGNLTKDVELRYTQSGKAIAEGTIAVQRKFQRDKTDFINVVVWGKAAENYFAKYGKKGDQAAATGELNIDTWKKDDGSWGYKAYINANDVKLVGGRKEDSMDGFQEVDMDDDIPF